MPLSALIALATASCTYEFPDPNCVESGEVRVEFDWRHVPEGELPEGMGVFLYHLDDEVYWRYDIRPSGGNISPQNSHYNILTYNNDAGAAIFVNIGQFNTAMASSRPTHLADGIANYTGAQPPRAKSAGQEVMSQPDRVVADALPDVVFRTNAYDTITFTPKPIVARYNVHIGDVSNLESAAQASMSLTNLAAGYLLATRQPLDVAATVPGSLEKSSETSLEGSILNYGCLPSATENWLAVYVWLRDGQKMVFQYDVHDQIASAPDPMNVDIYLNGIQLPSVETKPEGGLDVGVDNWEIIDIELSNR